MQKLIPVEEAKALMKEAKERVSIDSWELREKPSERLRRWLAGNDGSKRSAQHAILS